jgi:hypothetical protein
MSTQATAPAVETSSERAAQPHPQTKSKSKSLKLKMGQPNQCYENAMRHVFAMPKRLKYVEGFEITEYDDGVTTFNHHAQVLDTVTGKIHEVTPGHDIEEAVYVYRSFTRDELVDIEGEVLTDPDWWTHQLTLQAQRDLLIESGYSVELWAVSDDNGHLAFPNPEHMTWTNEQAFYSLNEGKGTGDELTWRYAWRLAATELNDANAMTAGAAIGAAA